MPILQRVLRPLASLKLAVVLMALSMLLIYAGTWAQIDQGIWEVQKKYFHSLWVWIDFALFLPRPRAGETPLPGGFPFPGGYTLGTLLLINLLAAHTVRFKFTWRRLGIILIHFGLILLLVGEGVTSLWASESQMVLDEGGWSNYTQDVREVELAVSTPVGEDRQSVAAVRRPLLFAGSSVRDARLPFTVNIDRYMDNARLEQANQPNATAEAGLRLNAVEIPVFSGTDAGAVNAPAAYVTLRDGDKNLGTWLLTPLLEGPQIFEHAGKTWRLELRFRREYKPYRLHLLDFAHDRYLGTEIARNFSSRVRLVDPGRNEDREALIKMNEPLRYAGETFYQASFRPGDTTSILQVVRNPGWLIPYIACAIGTVGLVGHFGLGLVEFLRRRKAADSSSQATVIPRSELIVAALAALACIVAFAAATPRPAQTGPYDLATFGTLPVSYEGRVQPLDSLARNSLKILSHKQALRVNDQRRPAIEWMADAMAHPAKAADYPVFRIDDRGVLGVLGFDYDRKLFSLTELIPHGDKLDAQFAHARDVDPREQNLYQKSILKLAQKLELYTLLSRQMGRLYLVPPLAGGHDWMPLGQALQIEKTSGGVGAAERWVEILQAYHEERPGDFNYLVRSYADTLHKRLPAVLRQVRFEAAFNRIQPFTWCMGFYVLALLLAAGSWLIWPGPLARAALWVLIVAAVIHTLGLAGRVYISGRPPVTNLASSAIFIAWGAVIMAIFLERVFRSGVGSATAAAIGFCSLLIADRLAVSGDTLKVLVAVLDTNFWLATHVVVITLGYSATFLAGFLGIVYVFNSLWTRQPDSRFARHLPRMIYGIVCFALLFSFVGTILGGIWADQSWGRFWGWDPKENGAVLIVLWNAIILHARWGGMIRARGMALLALTGNIITAWSWFGTNMLGVGLHSYGFMDSAFFWLMAFVFSQVCLIAVGSLPLSASRHTPDLQTASTERNP